ncbi:MAG: hypothetical protein AAF598_06660 [Bacteroidota bacterium]
MENGWPQNKQWNPKTQAGHPDVELLGPRQETFLETWVENWSSDTYLKALISQSPFCNVATLPADIYHDKYVPKLPRYRKEGYPEDDRPVADFDSNAFGVWGLKKFMGKEYDGTHRTTFVINDGAIERVFSKVKSKEHSQQILASYETPTIS